MSARGEENGLKQRPAPNPSDGLAGETELWRRLRRQGDPAAREELVRRYLPFAKNLALRYRGASESLDDLLQVANLGLVNAIDRFEPARGTPFSAFASPTILGELKRHFRDRVWTVRVPRGLHDRMAEVEKATAALSIEPVQPADWVKQSLAGLQPVRAGRFLVHGAHDRGRVRPNDIAIEIEAALAFGTGHHGTTRGCLLALDDLAKRRRVARVLDVGTGSGVLAIAAAKRLHARVTASDIDRIAVEAARGNARLNRAGAAIAFVRAAGATARAITAGAPYDLIFANILLGPLVRLAVPLTRLAAPGAHIVLSGLLPGHANAALAIYRAQGLVLERRIPLDGWVTLMLRRS